MEWTNTNIMSYGFTIQYSAQKIEDLQDIPNAMLPKKHVKKHSETPCHPVKNLWFAIVSQLEVHPCQEKFILCLKLNFTKCCYMYVHRKGHFEIIAEI